MITDKDITTGVVDMIEKRELGSIYEEEKDRAWRMDPFVLDYEIQVLTQRLGVMKAVLLERIV